jgi:hypothetical protein
MTHGTMFPRTAAAAVLALAAAFAPPSASAADTASDASADAVAAQAAYDRGIQLRTSDPATGMAAFRESALRWQAVLDHGADNGPLHYNLGNAQLQAGDVGRAIVSYLRAERHMPGDADLAHNLAQARRKVEHSFERSGGTLLVDSVARWWHLIPLGTRFAAAWIGWAAFWALVAWRIAAPATLGTDGRRIAWRTVTAAALAAWVACGGSILADRALAAARPAAVLVESGVTLRKGNGDGFEAAFAESLGPGVECTVLSERPGWVQLQLPDGRSGWVKDSQVQRV